MSETTATDVWPGGVPVVGQSASMSRTITHRDIELFSEISGDYNPLHYDEEYAAASPFGEIIVQGGVTTAILNAVGAEKLPGPGGVFLNLNLDFRAPVRPGDTITGTVEIIAVREDKPIATCRVSVTRDDGVVAVEGTALTYSALPPGAAA
jgi:acyl dehydratase